MRQQMMKSIVALLLSSLSANVVFAAESAKPTPRTKSEIAPQKDGDQKVRNFYQVLEDVLADFEYDLKNGQVKGLRDTAIRNIATSENVPTSFKSHLELLITERVIQNTRGRLIQCLPCRSKRAKLSGNNVIISSPDTDPAHLSRIAKNLGISNFMDVAFAYQPSGMILSLFVAEAETGSVIWSRSYNSETSRAAAFRQGVDYNQIDEARRQTEYEPSVQYRPTIYYLFEQDVSSSFVGTLGIGFRMMERYDNRKKEVGFELNYLLDVGSLIGSSGTSTASVYSGFNLTLLFVHAWNLIGNLENFHKPRGSIFAAIGGTYASGFLGGLIRAGYEWRLGKHWAVSANLGFRPPATFFVGTTSQGSVSGLELGLGISALF